MPSTTSRMHASLILLSCMLLAACTQPAAGSLPAVATAGSEPQVQHIVALVDQNLITARITGISMDSLALHVRNVSAQPLQIDIPAGTFFVARNPLVQNMVARHPTRILIQPFEERDVQIDAACANVRRAEPGSADTFAILRASEQAELAQVIATLNGAGVQYPVEQAAIWIVTDDASYDDLGMLVGGSRYGSALIGENEAVRAMLLVSQAGLDITKYSIWRERETLRSKLTEADLTSWLDKQLASAPSTQSAAAQPTSAGSGEQISQWASSAKADYELNPDSAAQATGAPNSNGCGEQSTAWASGDNNPGARLTLFYDQAVSPTRIVIYETYNPGAIFYVEVRDRYVNTPYQVYQADARLDPQCPHTLSIDVKDIPGAVNVIQISMDQSLGWTQIDAVELIGTRP